MGARLIGLILCTAFLLTSCSLSPLPAGADLLKAPSLNKRQAEVSEALAATMNLSEIIYRYPMKGDEFRAPFVFYDLDGDGSEEAMVFYSLASRSTEIRAKVLRRDGEGNWYSLHDIPGQGDQIEVVEFARLTSMERPCMLLCWLDSNRQERQLEIFSMQGISLEREAQLLCAAYSIVEYPGQLSRLLIVTQQKREDPLELQLLGGEGRLRKLASLWLDEEVGSILQMEQSLLWDNTTAVFLDEVPLEGTVATEIVRYDQNSLTLVAGSGKGQDAPEMEYYIGTFRPDTLVCVDVDKDGILEVPMNAPLPGIEESDEVIPIRKTEYKKLGQDGFTLARSAVVDNNAGYLIFLPDRWLEAVTVVDNLDSNQRGFYKLDLKTLLPTTELLRIAVYSTRDYEEAPNGYVQLGERGAIRFYGHLPALADEELALTEEELRELFSLT